MSDSIEELDFVEVSGKQGWENKLSGAVHNVRLSGKGITTAIRKVKPRRLQQILDENDFEFGVNVMFVDVEGHEINVLKSADWLQKKPEVIVIENTGPLNNQEKLRSFIIGKGYKLFARIDIADYIFIHD